MTIPRTISSSIAVLLKLGLFIPLCVTAVLSPYSILLGWSLLTALLFWFVLAPFLTFLFSRLFKITKTWQTAFAMLCFYGWAIFMTYEHHNSDSFTIMIASLVYNVLIMMIVVAEEWKNRRRTVPSKTLPAKP